MSGTKLKELASFGQGGVAFGCGLLGATGATAEQAKENRLLEIERRILALEAAFKATSR